MKRTLDPRGDPKSSPLYNDLLGAVPNNGGMVEKLQGKGPAREKLLVELKLISIKLETEEHRNISRGPWGNGLLGPVASAQPSLAPG